MNLPGKLFWRIYLFGLLLIIAATVAAVLPSIIVEPNARFHGSPHRIREWVTSELHARLNEPVELQKYLDHIASLVNSGAAVYTRDGVRLAASGGAPPPALEAKNHRCIGKWRSIRSHGIWVYSMPLGDDDAPYLVIDGKGGGPRRLFLALGAVLLTVGILSWPLARAITRPLERLSNSARALASGDLSARSGVIRKDEVGELAKTLDNMADRLEERIHSEKELLANISHEIRTPLARLRVAIELCEDAPGDAAETMERLRGMGSDLAELESLLENVLASARLDLASSSPASIPVRLRRVAMSGFLEKTRERFERRYTDRVLEINSSVEDMEIMLDPDLFNRVCDNLLDNAVKYSPPNAKPILIAKKKESRLNIQVMDYGRGVPEEDLPRLFDPFFRSDRSRSRKTGGTGLGLTLCKRIVEAHYGTISASANPKGGLIIDIEIPG
ncbi:Signal transduction histidine kinase [Desulfatibacillum alkenivorans DSM 16219]|jgi:signal transduction histidine kinase|uniref:histidine kinase n=1 Tax=Desulfatibacillum alkenivorans DSM 16219 TaxID=1121393 RepID=A0A1M6PVD8_9BACT|nr:ATP-binding protein [Desulfatibacillum alkenivorans]SHK11886.1 Signal transduction histidine kinase [Desulfatibacillum alkenivorans DSM 16219]